MNREIKFRAWDKEKNAMFVMRKDNEYCGKFVYTPPIKGMIYVKNWDSTIFEPDNFIVMQYTGLKDKNGKEIYEGDIVKGVVKYAQLLTWDTDENSNFKMGGIVYYDHSGFSLKVIQTMCDIERDGMVNYFDFIGNEGQTFDEREVIGNIYENSELVK